MHGKAGLQGRAKTRIKACDAGGTHAVKIKYQPALCGVLHGVPDQQADSAVVAQSRVAGRK